ncbi:MAG: metabolite traffic protein EboE [Akkermansiaceae bacterium]|jgi:hypothetical protein|nr:metabolite traffic protein EboE [Akkermansiaceae bacterium]
MRLGQAHLSYCTNIHPAESWEETRAALEGPVMAVAASLRECGALAPDASFGIGLRLSARAARELLEGGGLPAFRDWLAANNSYVFTINGFPYGDFHGTRVKERVFQPDWADPVRVAYTRDLFRILAEIAPPDVGASVSTLPCSLKAFGADERLIRRNLVALAQWIEDLAARSGLDLHLGLEPEPLGHIENTRETLALFERLHCEAPDGELLRRRIGLNYDACHFALQYEEPDGALDLLTAAGIRLSKIHLSSALALDPRDPAAMAAIRGFDEPTYFHQVLTRDADGLITRHADLPDFLTEPQAAESTEARVHFHIPLDAEPAAPLRSTRDHVTGLLGWCTHHPDACRHFEIETYTWGVLPPELRRPVTAQIVDEFRWVLGQWGK